MKQVFKMSLLATAMMLPGISQAAPDASWPVKAAKYESQPLPDGATSTPVIIRADTYAKLLVQDFEKVQAIGDYLGIIDPKDLSIRYLENGYVKERFPIKWELLETAIYSMPVRDDQGFSVSQLVNNFYVDGEPTIYTSYHRNYFSCVGNGDDVQEVSFFDKEEPKNSELLTAKDSELAVQSEGIKMCVDGLSIDGLPCDESTTNSANVKRDYSNLGSCITSGVTRYGYAGSTEIMYQMLSVGRLDNYFGSDKIAGMYKPEIGDNIYAHFTPTPLNPLITQESVIKMNSDSLGVEAISDTPQSRYIAAAIIDAGVQPNKCSFSPFAAMSKSFSEVASKQESEMANYNVVSMLNVFYHMAEGRPMDLNIPNIGERVGIYGLCDTIAIEGIPF